MATVNLTANTGNLVQQLEEVNSVLARTQEEAKKVGVSADKAGDKMADAANAGESGWTKVNNALEVAGKAFDAVIGSIQKFHEIQKQGRKESMQWESMMNSTKASEISAAYAKIDKAYGASIDKATKMRMAYSAGFSDIKYDVESFANIVQNMAQRTGKDVQEVAEELQQGFLKGDLGMLEDNGIMHNAELELQKYAGSIGKTADELTDFEKRQANTTILQKYLNAEFNNTKPLQDAYIDLTNKATNVTEGFSSKIAELTDNVFGLNSGLGNLSIGRQMDKIRQEIKDAESALWKQGSLSVDIEKDMENINKKTSKLLALQGESANILTSRLVNQMGIRKATTKQEIKGIVDDIDSQIASTNERLKGFIANGKIVMTEETSKLMIQVEALRNARKEALKEGDALGKIKPKAAGGKSATVDPVKNMVESMKVSSEEAKNVYSDATKAMDAFNSGLVDANSLTADEELRRLMVDAQIKFELIKQNMDTEGKIIEDGLANQRRIQAKDAEEKAKIDRMKFAVLSAAANSFYNDLINGQEDILQRTAAIALQTAGSQIFADGLERMWKGGGDMLKFSNPVLQAEGSEQFAYGIAEVAGGLALGYAGKKLMPSSGGSEDTSKSTAADDRNKFKGQNQGTMDVYLYPDEKHYLRSLNKSFAKIGGNK